MESCRIDILVVDDAVDGADSTLELLRCWGYDGRACYDGVTALESARAREPDAVLLDIALPDMDGFRFARLFRQQPGRESIPIIAISGYGNVAYRTIAQEVGIRHYLLKPVDPARLRELLTREIDAPAIHEPLFVGTVSRKLPPVVLKVVLT